MKTKKLINAFYIFRMLRYSYFHVAIGLLYFQSIGLSLAQALALESVYYIAKSIFDVPAGFGADKFGRKKTLIISSILCSIAYLIIGTNEKYYVLACAQIILGLAMSMATSIDSAMLYEKMKNLNITHKYQKVEANGWAIRNVSFAIASTIGAIIAYKTSLGTAFIMSAVVILLASFVAYFNMNEPSFKPIKSQKHYIEDMKVVFADKGFSTSVVYFSVIFVGTRVGFWAFQPTMQQFNVPTQYFGILFAITLLASAAASVKIDFFDKLYFSRLSVLYIILTISLMIVAAGLFEGGTVGIIIAMIGFVFHALAQGIFDPIRRYDINKKVQGNVRASVLAVAVMLGNVGFSIFAPIYGWLIESFGNAKANLWVGAAIGVSCILLLRVKRYFEQKHNLIIHKR